MTKITGTKLKMTQIWKDEAVVPVTPIRLQGAVDELPFKAGDKVNVRGVTKGRGFQGVVKRHGFGGGPKTHGQKNRHRAPGSIGSTAAQRVVPGRKMAGHMGTTNVTVLNLFVVDINTDTRTLLLRGAVPGHIGGKVELRLRS